MQIGVSSYSFAKAISSGDIDILGVIDWVADHGGDHLEIAEAGLDADLQHDAALVDAIRESAAKRSLPLSNYVVSADFRGPDPVAEVERIAAQLDVARRLGVGIMRHDVTAWGWIDSGQAEYEDTFGQIVPICQELADRAATLGITTCVENHGYFMNNGERVRRLVHAVNRPNFATLLDVGNFWCVGDNPLISVRRGLPFAKVVHLKDFHRRETAPADGWLTTLDGSAIIGTVLGWGDLPLAPIGRAIVESGFDGPVAIEFEGPEDPFMAVESGLAAARALLEGEN